MIFTLAASACSGLSDEGQATARAADAAAVRLLNSPLVEHYEDMTQQNLLAAAVQEGVEVVGVSRLDRQDSDYEWNELIIRVDGTPAIGLDPQPVRACWKIIVEGRFQRGDEELVDCPTGAPPTFDTPTTVPPQTTPATIVTQREQLVEQMRSVLTSSENNETPADALDQQVLTLLSPFGASTVETTTTNRRLAIAVVAGSDCYFGLATDPVSVWLPVAGGVECSAANAALGGP